MLKMMFGIISIVFICEFLIMFFFLWFPVENKYLEMMIDSLGLSLLITPLIWFVIIRRFERERYCQ